MPTKTPPVINALPEASDLSARFYIDGGGLVRCTVAIGHDQSHSEAVDFPLGDVGGSFTLNQKKQMLKAVRDHALTLLGFV